ncbi:unnamed protein product [Closterium sp. NIES-53]
MASLHGLGFDHEGRSLQFDTWLDDLQLYLLSDSRDSVSLFDHTSGAAPAPPATTDTQALYDAVVARYSSRATAALGRLLLPYLFPELPALATIEDLVSHLCTSDARYRAAAPAEDHFLSLDPTVLTNYLLEQHLLASETCLVAVGASCGTPRTPFFEGCSPSPLAPSYASAAAVDVPSAEDVGAASAIAKRRSSKGKGGRGGGGGSGSDGGGSSGGGGSGGSGGGSGGFGGGGGGSGGSGGSGSGGSGGGRTGAQRGGSGGGPRQQQQRRSDTPSPQQLREWLFQRGASGGSVSYPYVIRTGDRTGQTCGKPHTHHRCFSRLDDAWRAEFGDDVERPHWAELLRSGVAIFELEYDAILSAMYALSASAEGDCYRCMPPNPGLVAAALGASESSLPGIAPAEDLHTFTLDLGASRCFFRDSTTLTPLPAPVPVRRVDPFGGQVESVYTGYRASSGSCVCPSVRVRSGSTPLLMSPPVAPESPVAPPPGSPLPATPAWHALPPPCLWSSSVSASPLALACPALPSLRRWADLPVLRLHSDRGGEFSSTFLREFCRGEGILQSFTLPDSPLQNGIAERRICLVMEVARTSMIHVAAPHFLWPFAVRYAAHQLNLWPRVSLPKTSPTLRWTGEVGDASVFQFYRPTSRRVFPSQDVTFDESVPFYRLFPYRSAPPPPPPLFLAPGPPPVDPLLPQGPAPSGVSQVDPLPSSVPVEVVGDSGAARGAASGGAEPGGAKSEGAESGGAEPGGAELAGAEPAGVERGGAELEGVEPGDTESEGAESGGAEPRAGDTRDTKAGCARVTAGAGGTKGIAVAGPGGARTRGTGAAGTGGVGGAGVGDPTEPGAARLEALELEALTLVALELEELKLVALAREALKLEELELEALTREALELEELELLTLEALCGHDQCREPASRPVSLVRTARRVPRSRPQPVPGMHAMALRPSSVPLHVPLSPSPESSLLAVPDPESNLVRAASPTVSRLLATVVTNPSFESTAASALVFELLDLAAACRLDYATALVVESESANPPSIEGECALGTDVLEDRQEDFECLAPALPHFTSMLLAPEGDPDAPDIPTPRSCSRPLCSWGNHVASDISPTAFFIRISFRPLPTLPCLGPRLRPVNFILASPSPWANLPFGFCPTRTLAPLPPVVLSHFTSPFLSPWQPLGP